MSDDATTGAEPRSPGSGVALDCDDDPDPLGFGCLDRILDVLPAIVATIRTDGYDLVSQKATIESLTVKPGGSAVVREVD